MAKSNTLWSLQVGLLREVSNKAHNAELKLFLEVEFGLVKKRCHFKTWDYVNYWLCFWLSC